ncbi:class I SAM-dependent methyltransferase [Anaerolineales bacterium HSG6]|nr:class I SAM-dependent methyltransferase [Anaerolineales bacterium HSG6]MDM8531057.1 class I SAM-dependent methyltransferase [Anaerolineales bacterium HSG25]
MKNTIKQFVPQPLIPSIKYIYLSINDIIERLQGKRDSLTPPTRLMFVGTPDVTVFKHNGEIHLKYFKGICDLQPNETILDVGCGIGRKALPLTKYLNSEARYEGFDIVKAGIDWCQQKITPLYPNFHFQLADMYNKHYNPTGKYKASEYKFPYKDNSFDFVMLTSVFTHMLPPDVENYFAEISRVMKIGGRCFISYFLANDTSLSLMSTEKSQFNFKHATPNYRTVDPDVPENAVCYDEAYI